MTIQMPRVLARWHRYATPGLVRDYLACGWMALPSLEGTVHGPWRVHCVWLCDCRMVEPIDRGPAS